MRLFLHILFLVFLINDLRSQDLIKQLERNKDIRKDKEFIKEINVLSNRLFDSLNLNLNSFDTIFIARCVDIQSRSGYGLIWNSKISISYSDYKKWKGNKIVDSDPKFEINQKSDSWNDFIDLFPMIQKWDTAGINNYVKKSNESTTILSGVYWWRILRICKIGTAFKIDNLIINNFIRIKEK